MQQILQFSRRLDGTGSEKDVIDQANEFIRDKGKLWKVESFSYYMNGSGAYKTEYLTVLVKMRNRKSRGS